MKRLALSLLVCTWTLVSQHQASDGLWWRSEMVGVSAEECRAALKKITTRPVVGFVKWYDITPQHLEKSFGQAATPDKGTWVSCWPEAYRFGEPDS